MKMWYMYSTKYYLTLKEDVFTTINGKDDPMFSIGRCNIDADTAICDQLLVELYRTTDIQSAGVSRKEFENFMLEYIV